MAKFTHGQKIVHHQVATTRPGFIGLPKEAIYISPDVRADGTPSDRHIIRIKHSKRSTWGLASTKTNSITPA